MLVGCSSKDNSVYDIVWKDFTNKEIKLEAYKDKWIIVNYWATWCVPCIKEMPILQKFYQQSNLTTIVIGANIEHSDGFVTAESILKFTKKLNIHFPIVKANIELDKVSLGKIKALPTTVIINPKGKVIHTHLGQINQQQLKQYTTD
jgi:thiol-disulfide isomerase/thioredoxin